ncbi:MAG TPA: thiosulfate oxidation carrier protein SoxY [Planctomycetes bacterium]|nr:thiosulfate oxidation carrier protein SoxY [Planctomycetota bacterium]
MTLGCGLTSRRDALRLTAISALAVALAPRLAFASKEAVSDEIKKLYGDKPIAEGKVKLDLPEIAENGLVVPLNIEVQSPMTETDYVKAVHVFAEGNPLPQVVSYRFTPDCGRAGASVRMRLAETQTVMAIAEMSDGSLHSAKAEVKVTIGGCGG